MIQTETHRSPSLSPCLSSHQALPLLPSNRQDSLSFDAGLQHLYAAVIAHGRAQPRKRKASEEEEDQPPAEEADTITPSQGVFDLKSGKIPAGFLKPHS